MVCVGVCDREIEAPAVNTPVLCAGTPTHSPHLLSAAAVKDKDLSGPHGTEMK